ncbi:SRPBCC domain-containing protein [Demequina activiva]|uniref:Activator of Hsp90 ATPase homologue 1/2-like C-terminal domain-containing protein n=1 Tax=Demequina activiva TaxID=1582364 RepID=A0A919Q2F6_9MICO|nr:SRPBCC domain-containing protein [Demequina activiva]GIG55035.1 hypothetical protein Dac01nite_17870 [Demequina activiva]
MDAVDVPDPALRGEVLNEPDGPVLRFERIVPAGPAAVWEAVTSRDGTAAWSFPLEFEPRAGGSVLFDSGEMGTISGTVVAWDPGALLEYEWGGPEGRWHVRFVIEPAGDSDGSVITFEHLSPDPHHPDYAAGWHWHLDRLEQYLAGDTPAQVPQDEHFEELQRLYSGAEG